MRAFQITGDFMNFTESSLTILYLLQEAKIPLNMEQICAALASSSEFTYIDASISISSMLDKKYLIEDETPLGKTYSITVDGRISLAHLKTDIRGSIRRGINEYVSKNLMKFSLESKISSRINILDDGKYQVHLRAFDKDMSMSDIVIVAHDEDEAKLIVHNWEKNADDAISALYGVLIKDI